ncbi:hypothetical protein ACI6KS_001728 [Vibrio parahaemolyticus]
MKKITTFLNTRATELKDADPAAVCEAIYHIVSIVLLGVSTIETVQAILGYHYSTFVIIYGVIGIVTCALSIMKAIDDFHYLYICVWLFNMAMLCLSASMNYVVIIGGEAAVINYGQSIRDAIWTNIERTLLIPIAAFVAAITTLFANLIGVWLTRHRC